MKDFFKPSKLLFYVLTTLVFFFLGMVFAGITDAGKGQGLAGGAIVLSYGVISAGLAFLVSIFSATSLSSGTVVRLNKILLLVFAVMLLAFVYRIQTLNGSSNQVSYQGSGFFFQC